MVTVYIHTGSLSTMGGEFHEEGEGKEKKPLSASVLRHGSIAGEASSYTGVAEQDRKEGQQGESTKKQNNVQSVFYPRDLSFLAPSDDGGGGDGVCGRGRMRVYTDGVVGVLSTDKFNQ